jgi:signal peptidase II
VREGRFPGLKRNLPVGVAIALTVVILDQWSKAWAEQTLVTGDIVIIPGLFSLHLEENPGAAFSIFQNAGPFLGSAAILATGILAVMLARNAGWAETVGFGLIMGGAVGNLVDRIVRGDGFLDGRVIDWLQLPRFPTFNLANASITAGVIVLLLASLRRR